MNNPFLKRLIKEETKDVVHTSAYGEAQNSGKMGTTSTASFLDRLKIDRNRSKVRGYNDSKIVNETRENGPQAKKYDITQDKMLSSEKGAEEGGLGKRGVGANSVNSANRGGFSGRGANSTSGVTSNTGRPAQPPARKNPGIFR